MYLHGGRSKRRAICAAGNISAPGRETDAPIASIPSHAHGEFVGDAARLRVVLLLTLYNVKDDNNHYFLPNFMYFNVLQISEAIRPHLAAHHIRSIAEVVGYRTMCGGWHREGRHSRYGRRHCGRHGSALSPVVGCLCCCVCVRRSATNLR